MISPDDPASRLILGIVFLALTAALVIRAIRKDRREYARFKRYRSTLRRQRMFRRWLIDSAAWFGGSSVVVLVLTWQFVPLLLEDVQRTRWVTGVLGFLSSGVGTGVVIAVIVVVFGGGVLAIVLARKSETVATVGDIAALLPRNRSELGYGAALSINAGIVEESLFRLAIPALLFGVTGNAWVSIGLSLALFGLLHVYQGAAGIIGSTVIGVMLMALYLASGSILVAIVVHALIDLRSLVLIPMVIYGAHRVSGATVRSGPQHRPRDDRTRPLRRWTRPTPGRDA